MRAIVLGGAEGVWEQFADARDDAGCDVDEIMEI